MITTDSGLQYQDTHHGEGDTAQAGHFVTVHYTGWLWEGDEKGEKFDSSLDRQDPFAFALGEGIDKGTSDFASEVASMAR